MGGDEGVDLSVLVGLDLRGALGELAGERVADAGHIIFRLVAVCPLTWVEAPVEPLGEDVHEDALVQLGQGHDLLEQAARVERPPRAVEGLGTVEHDDVGVQVRVSGATVPVVERRRDDPAYLLLDDAVGAGAGEEHVPLGMGQRAADRLLMRLVDHRLRPRVRDGPSCGH